MTRHFYGNHEGHSFTGYDSDLCRGRWLAEVDDKTWKAVAVYDKTVDSERRPLDIEPEVVREDVVRGVWVRWDERLRQRGRTMMTTEMENDGRRVLEQ